MVLSTVLFTLKEGGKKGHEKGLCRDLIPHGGSFCTGADTRGGINLHIRNVQYLIGNESLYLSIQYNVTQTFIASFLSLFSASF